ncbi:restriction endonuclease subunit S [Microcystis sp. CS-574]|uniref:restriction endonuclease subunit S n=1 Tax=Microcystis sp. CS-574 TaxID=3021718 RepID=UPI002330A86A|nr:restriction endonuclease subunit S [Microcystis sp. CS-574]MDB9405247.1 restriction endonuclease subunit S [Microcystis sp. CS-574]
MKNWDVKKLRDLADIRVSNVDKKIYPSERPVKLCNYMDVYTNEYIDGSIQFMEGSANDAEIERFGLNIGDVIITKDSETPDDIGIPTVIHEQIDNLVCGYHLALIRPDNEKIDSIFLSKYLSTSRVANYFALHASGSTRFGLPIGAIESVEILTPPIKEQTQIATILSTIDRAIEQTEALIAKQQRIKTGLMQDLLTKGIDENGNIRSEETHEFKDSPLGRIPVEWEVVTTGQVTKSLVPGRDKPDLDGGGVPWITIPDIEGMYLDLPKSGLSLSLNAIKVANARLMPKGTVLMSCVGEFGIATITECDAVANQQLHGFICDQSILPEWLIAQINASGNRIDNMATQTTIKYLNKNGCESILITLPSLKEQVKIISILDNINDLFEKQKKSLNKLRSLKTGLMQDLLTGKVRVIDLLNQKTAAN